MEGISSITEVQLEQLQAKYDELLAAQEESETNDEAGDEAIE